MLSFSKISQSVQGYWKDPSILLQKGGKISRILHAIAVETFATFRHVIPAALKWWFREVFTDEFFIYSFSSPRVHVRAKLYQHGPLDIKENESCHPILFVHGDYGHPFTLLHLADMAKKVSKNPVFSLYIPSMHNDQQFRNQAVLIDEVIEKIESLVKEQKGIFSGVFAVGHSKGAMLVVERLFDLDSPKIAKAFSIAGPLQEVDECFQEPLKTIFKDLSHKINFHKERKVVQIIPDNDWLVPYHAMAIRPDDDCYSVPGMHLSGLYSIKTSELFKRFFRITPEGNLSISS